MAGKLAFSVALSTFLTICQGSSFLAPQVSTAHVRQSLWAELGSRSNPTRLAQLEEELRPVFAALPKGEHGNLEHAAVRYAAHRYFVHRHGWHMRGLEPHAASSNMSNQASIKADMVPSYIQDVFEEYLGRQGFTLHDLAVYIATLENVVNEERMEELRKAVYVHDVVGDISLSNPTVDDVLSTYMTSYILGMNLSNPQHVKLPKHKLEAVYPGWTDTVAWLGDVRQTVEFSDANRRNPFVASATSVAGVERLVDVIGDRYGAFQDLECRALKDALVSMEHLETGRVRLKDFYSKGLGGEWLFTESVAYLRELGALDESDPKRPSVIIPNYVAGPSNCLVSTGFYAVCCKDECEDLVHQVEAALATPLANVSDIARTVSSLASDTVHAPRNLSEDLMGRLGEIANHHGGRIPIHGRLFAQFMHHAYPRECPYPHVSGTTAPMHPSDFAKAFGEESISISRDDHRKLVADWDDSFPSTVSLPWAASEELVAQHRHGHRLAEPSNAKAYFRALVFLMLAASVGVHFSRRLSISSSDFDSKHHFV